MKSPTMDSREHQMAIEGGVTEGLSDSIARNQTANDQRDMQRMGKEQEFTRNFHILTSIAFTSCAMGTWEFLLTANAPALVAGGTAGLFWSMIWGYVGQTFVVLSLGEMASMAPTAGGQYHWVSEFAAPKHQKILSYTSGWLSSLAWQAFVVVDSFLLAELLQALIEINNPSYVSQRWHTTLLTIAIVTGMGLFNIFAARWLAIAEAFFAVLHFTVWIPLMIVLLVMTPEKQSGRAALLDFTDNDTGWDNTGITVLIGQVSAMFTVLGSDCAAHIAEEIRDAGVVVPRSMWWSFVANMIPALASLVTYCFCIGNVGDAASASFPIVYVFQNSTGSARGATALTTILFILLLINSTSTMASTSRITFAFARDNGFPAGKWISKVNPKLQVGVNSIVLTVLFTVVLSLINIGSTTALNAFLSVSVVALMATYTISIACVLRKRLRGETLVPARWSLFGSNAGALGSTTGGGLGRWGIPINSIGLVYSLWSFFWSFWPSPEHVTPVTMNYAVVIFAGIMTTAVVVYAVHARKVYHGPVSTVRQMDEGSDESPGVQEK